MKNANDERVLLLQEKAKEKKEKLKKYKKKPSITNNILVLDNQTYNLHVLKKNELVLLLVKLESLRKTWMDIKKSNLGIDLETLEISGYTILDWKRDIVERIKQIEISEETAKLKAIEKQLAELLSTDKRTELALDEIENQLI